MLVVNWQAPAARPFYTATPAEPHGVTLRRRFRLKGRTLTGISDEALDGSLADAAAAVDDFLLEELERARDARMRDIVATIQADQYGLIAREPEPPLVIQGGPGTGKTAVGLHRASYLLFSHRDELRRILVVGPNPVFMDYVSHVLPSLGEDAVDQRAVGELVEGAEVTLVGPARRRAAEGRRAARRGRAPRGRAALAGRAAGARRPHGGPVRRRARARGRGAARRGALGARALGRGARAVPDETCSAASTPTTARQLGGLAVRAFDEVERSLRKDGVLNGFLDAVWPAPRARAGSCASCCPRASGSRRPRTGSSTRTSSGCSGARAAAGAPPTSRSLDEARALLHGAPARTAT